MTITEKKRNDICRLIRECGAIMLQPADPEHTDGDITVKPGAANYVTVYDLRVQNALIDGLRRLFPDASFFAEEKENDGEVCSRGLCFVIDPIDGTTNFIHQMGASAVSVALFEDAVPVFGAVYDPYRSELFHACLGGGAFLNDRRIRVSDRDLPHALVSFGTSPYDRETLADATFARVRRIFMACADIRRGGSAALDVCYVAAGRTDAYFEERLSPWDFAAGGLILSEAGGVLTDFSGGKPSFGKKSSVLCSNAKLHGAVLDIIKI